MKGIIKYIVVGIVVWLVSFIIGNILSFGYIILSQGIDASSINQVDMNGLMNNLNPAQLRWVLFFSHMFAFFVPSIFISLILFKGEWKRKLELIQANRIWDYGIGVLLLLTCLPATLYLNYIGMQWPWPEFMKNSDLQAYAMMETLFSSEGILSIVLNVLLIGGMAAVGEELLFRGLIQRNLERWTNPIIAIVASSVIFGGLHLQADGMIARIILGGVLGYSYYISRSLWVPILVHFLYNSVQVLMVELSTEPLDLRADTQVDPGISWYLALVSLLLTLMIAYFWYRINQPDE